VAAGSSVAAGASVACCGASVAAGGASVVAGAQAARRTAAIKRDIIKRRTLFAVISLLLKIESWGTQKSHVPTCNSFHPNTESQAMLLNKNHGVKGKSHLIVSE
jgi:hypothetical protein